MSGGPTILKLSQASLGARTMYVRVTPTVLTFPERRAVLHALKQHGEIEVFKKLDSGKSTFISVATTESTAASLQARSPLRYELVDDASRGSSDSFLASWPSESISSSPEIIPSASTGEHQGKARRDTKRKEFTVHIFPAPSYPHKEQIRRSPLHGCWPKIPGRTTFMESTLRASVPDGIAAVGLADWETGGQFCHDAVPPLQENWFETEKEKDASEREARIRRRRSEEAIPLAMKGLATLSKSKSGKRQSHGDTHPVT